MKKTPMKTGESQVKVIQNLDELQAMVNEPVFAHFKLNGQIIRLECRRLTPEVDEQVRAIRRKSQPPFDPARKDYDYTNLKYLETLALNEKMARAVIIYTGCPAVAAKKPGLTSPTDIYNFVRTLLSENLLELIALTIASGGMEIMEVVERANFTSTSASES